MPFGLTLGSNKIRWSHLTRICLEALDPLISQLSQLSGIVLLVHQVLLVIDRHVPGGGELVVHLLPEAEGPVEGGTVVVAELGAGNLTWFFTLLSCKICTLFMFVDYSCLHLYMFEFYLGPDGGDKGGNLAQVGDGSLDPEQVGSVLEARHAVQHHSVL